MNLEDILKIGTRASQPLASSVAEGTLYSVTDESYLVEQSRSGAWITYAGSGSGGSSSTSVSRLISPLAFDGEDGLDGFPGLTGPIGPAGSGGAGSSVALPTLTPPVDGDFAWINQGGAAVVASGGTVYLSAPLDSGTQDWRIRKKTAPATPYTITAVFLRTGLCVNYTQFGLLFRNSGSGVLHVLSVQFNSAVPPGLLLNSVKYTSPTVYNSLYISTPFIIGRTILLRIADNGTSRICSISPDGINWIPYHTIGRTDYLTADEVGFGLDVSNTTHGSGITLVSWAQA